MVPVRSFICAETHKLYEHFGPFKDDDSRVIKLEKALAPHKEYFNKLKLAASKLPHEERKNKKGQNRTY